MSGAPVSGAAETAGANGDTAGAAFADYTPGRSFDVAGKTTYKDRDCPPISLEVNRRTTSSLDPDRRPHSPGFRILTSTCPDRVGRLERRRKLTLTW